MIYKKWNKTISLLLVVALLMMVVPTSAMAAPVGSDTQGTTSSSPGEPSSVEQVVYDEVAAENNHDWNTLPSYWVNDQKELLHSFMADTTNKDNFIGLYDITSARISEIKELPIKSVYPFVDVKNYMENYGKIKVFYVGIDYAVHEESMFYYNGVNYRLAVVVPENGQWKLAEMGDAPVGSLVASNDGFGSSAEKISAKIHQARNKGLFINPAGKIIANVAATPTELAEEKGSKALSINPSVTGDHVCPSNISIYLTKSVNYQFYGFSQPHTQSINFYYYLRNVLPDEWDYTWPAESLKAGAECVKMFAWYHVYNPKFPQYNAALTDSYTNSQSFQVNTAQTSTTNAINAVGGYGIETRNSLQLFETGYRGGNYDDSWYHYGLVSQWGTKWWANQGSKDWYAMLHYYYDNSWATGNQLILEFSY